MRGRIGLPEHDKVRRVRMPECLLDALPLGRPGRPDDVATAIFYLAVEGTYCTGAVLGVDGGWLA